MLIMAPTGVGLSVPCVPMPSKKARGVPTRGTNATTSGRRVRLSQRISYPETTVHDKAGSDACEGATENRSRPVIRGSQVDPAIRRTSDHEDSRRLAAGPPADLSESPRMEAQGSHPGVDSSALGRQTDPGDRRTSDWRMF